MVISGGVNIYPQIENVESHPRVRTSRCSTRRMTRWARRSSPVVQPVDLARLGLRSRMLASRPA
jgi:hypothetical protein